MPDLRASSKVTLGRIDAALATLADLIETRPEGEAYWPIFDRLEAERDRLTGRQERLRAARRRAVHRPGASSTPDAHPSA